LKFHNIKLYRGPTKKMGKTRVLRVGLRSRAARGKREAEFEA